MKRRLPLGIKLLRYIYLVNIALYFLSLVLFYNRIFILGQEANRFISALVRLAFIFLPLYLFFRLKALKKDAWFLAVYFHIFFLTNSIFGLLEYFGYTYSLVRIAGMHSSINYGSVQLIMIIFNTLINIFILRYLFKIKETYLNYK